MTGVVLPIIVAQSVVIAAVLILLIQRSASALAAAFVTFGLTVVLLLVDAFSYHRGSLAGLAWRWVLFALAPTAAVFAVSRSALIQSRPWLLLVVAPITAIVVVIIVDLLVPLPPPNIR